MATIKISQLPDLGTTMPRDLIFPAVNPQTGLNVRTNAAVIQSFVVGTLTTNIATLENAVTLINSNISVLSATTTGNATAQESKISSLVTTVSLHSSQIANLNLNAQPHITSVGTLSGLSLSGTLVLPAGTSTVAPAQIISGSLLTSPISGGIEWDGSKLYITQAAGLTRQIVAFQSDIANLAISIASNATPQAIGNVASSGTVSQYARADHVHNASASNVAFIASGNITVGNVQAAIQWLDANKSVQQDISFKANLASPSFTGIPAAPTANVGTNTTQIATTAFVYNSIQTSGQNSQGVKTISTSTPSGGASGDIWYQV